MDQQTLKESGLTFIEERLNSIIDSKFFEQEFKILKFMTGGFEYYKYIIENIELKDNENNSYILWACGKTSTLDKQKPVKFIPGQYSLPDIDIDVPGRKRDEIIEYIKDVYGHDNVSQMVTFGRLQGRSALKEVLRINEACGFAEMNEITKKLPNEADISTQLAEMDDDERSIILWSLQNNPDDFIDYCFINSKGELEGDYAEYFGQAIQMEGTFKTQGKHAAGVVISAEKLSEVCPMVNSKSSDEKIAGLEMADLEALGHVKFDILAINFLDKCMYIEDLIGKT